MLYDICDVILNLHELTRPCESREIGKFLIHGDRQGSRQYQLQEVPETPQGGVVNRGDPPLKPLLNNGGFLHFEWGKTAKKKPW